jgi:Icc-related predicted phosphoesterase
MDILVVSCIHNDVESLLTQFDKISQFKFDVIVCPGDFTNLNIPKGFTRIDIGRLIIEELKTFGKFLITVPGSWDKELIDLLKQTTNSVHGTGIVIDNVGFYGYGGARTPFNTPFEPSDSEIIKGLEAGYAAVAAAERKIQVTHMPPADTKLDVIFSGAHVGSPAIREFILNHKPDVAISAHIHEARGVDELGGTKLLNAGRFPEGYCGLVHVSKEKVEVEVVCLI